MERGNLEKDFEKESTPQKEIWVVDDEKEIIASLLRFWQIKTRHLAYSFKYFETAKSALEEIEKRKESKEKLPDLIFVDAQLDKDKEEEFKKGANLVKRIRDIKEIRQPKIIAHSSDFANNVELLAAGADLGFQKIDISKSAEFLQNPEKYFKKAKEKSEKE